MFQRLTRTQIGLLWLGLILLGGTGCGIDSRVTGEWDVIDPQNDMAEFKATFNKNGTVEWDGKSGTWSLVSETGMNAVIKTEGIGFTKEMRANFMTKDQGSIGESPTEKFLLNRTVVADDGQIDKGYALAYIIMSIFVVISMAAICRPASRAEEPPEVKEKRDAERAAALGRSRGH